MNLTNSIVMIVSHLVTSLENMNVTNSIIMMTSHFLQLRSLESSRARDGRLRLRKLGQRFLTVP